MLGSGTAAPDAERGPAGFLVEHGGHAWLVDGGSGTLQRCMRAGVDPRLLSGGFYSHRHPDHCADLVPLLFALRTSRHGRTEPYPIWAGTGFSAFMESLEEVYGHWITPDCGIAVHELPLDGMGRVEHEGLTVVTCPANHSAGALHLRFEADGAAVVFSGDTGPSEGLIALATGADLLVCECAGSDTHRVDGHMYPSAVAELARRARPRALWITHLYPTTDPEEVLRTVGQVMPLRLAADGDRWTAHEGASPDPGAG